LARNGELVLMGRAKKMLTINGMFGIDSPGLLLKPTTDVNVIVSHRPLAGALWDQSSNTGTLGVIPNQPPGHFGKRN